MVNINKNNALFEEFLEWAKTNHPELLEDSEDEFEYPVHVSRATSVDWADELNLGDEITFRMRSGELVQAIAVREDGESLLFVFKNALSEEHCMNSDDDNDNYDDMLHHLRELSDGLPKDIRVRAVADDGVILRLLTVGEVFGKSDSDYEYRVDEPDQLDYFKDASNRTCQLGEEGDLDYTCWWWLSNRVKDSAAGFALVCYRGVASYDYASYALGVRPAFSLYRRGL